MPDSDSSILQGTLDLMVLKNAGAPRAAARLRYRSPHRAGRGNAPLIVNQGTVYLCLVRLVQKKWIRAEWGVSDNNRKAKFLLPHEGRPESSCRPRP